MSRERIINAEWDDDAGVWVAASDDVPGLVTESKTFESLLRKLRSMAPELLELNHAMPKSGEVHYRVVAQRHKSAWTASMSMVCPIVIVCAAICAGCVPFTIYDLPRVDGQILDGATSNPIPNANVRVNPVEQKSSGTATPESVAISDTTGHFTVPEITHRIWLPALPFDLLYPDAKITISAPGYQKQQFDFDDQLRDQFPKGAIHTLLFRLNLEHS